MLLADIVAVETLLHRGKPHAHPRCTPIGVTVDAPRRLASGFRQDTSVALVIKREICAGWCRTWLPSNTLFHCSIVAGLAGGRLGPNRCTRLRRPDVTRRTVGKQILMRRVIEQVFHDRGARHRKHRYRTHERGQPDTNRRPAYHRACPGAMGMRRIAGGSRLVRVTDAR